MRRSIGRRLGPMFLPALALALAGCLGEQPYERRVAWVPNDDCVTPDCSVRTSLHRTGALATRVTYTQMPTFDIKATCHASATFQSQADDHYCMTDERTAQTQLKKQWATFKPAERQSCIEQSASLEPSYVETLTCLEMSKETKARAKTFAKPDSQSVDPGTPSPPPGPMPSAEPVSGTVAPAPDTPH